MSRRWLLLLLPFVVLLTHARASAQPTPADRALATELFQRGRTALVAQSYAEACPLLEESQRLDPAGGTLLNLALCHEQIGRTASAWSEFLEALSVARHDNREDRVHFAREHIAALEVRLSRLVVQVALDPALPGLRVERDGTPLGRSVWGVAMPVDPGEHTVRVSATGYQQLAQNVVVKDSGDVVTVTVAELTPNSSATSQAIVQVEPAQLAPPVVEPTIEPLAQQSKEKVGPPARPRLSLRRRVALSLFGLTVASAVAATAVGIKAINLRDKAENRCGDGYCTNDARHFNNKAMHYADASTVLTVVSGAAGLSGLAFWFWPQPTRAGHTAPVSAGLMLHGSF